MTTTSQPPATDRLPVGGSIATAVSSLLATPPGAFFAWGLICACAGAIPTLIQFRGLDEAGPVVFFAWIAHLILAGIGLWGIVFVLLHVVCLHALINTEAGRSRTLAGAFLNQLTVSTATSGFLANETSGYAWVAWAAACAALLPWLVRPLFEPERRSASRVAAPDRRAGDASPAAVKRFLLKGSRARPYEPRCKRRYDRAEVTRILRAKIRRHLTDPRVSGAKPALARTMP